LSILKECRVRKGLTQLEVARKVGISTRTYQAYEANTRTPDVVTAIYIANILGVQDIRKLWSGNSTVLQ